MFLIVLLKQDLTHEGVSFLICLSLDILLNTYWARSSPILKISMLPDPIVDDAEGGVHYGIWKHTNFQYWTRPSPNKCFSITYKGKKKENVKDAIKSLIENSMINR